MVILKKIILGIVVISMSMFSLQINKVEASPVIAPHLVSFFFTVLTGIHGDVSDRRLMKQAAEECVNGIIKNNRKFRVGYRCNPGRFNKKHCTRNGSQIRIVNRQLGHTDKKGRRFIRVFWQVARACVEEEAECSFSAISGHCADKVHYNQSTRAHNDIYLTKEGRRRLL